MRSLLTCILQNKPKNLTIWIEKVWKRSIRQQLWATRRALWNPSHRDCHLPGLGDTKGCFFLLSSSQLLSPQHLPALTSTDPHWYGCPSLIFPEIWEQLHLQRSHPFTKDPCLRSRQPGSLLCAEKGCPICNGSCLLCTCFQWQVSRPLFWYFLLLTRMTLKAQAGGHHVLRPVLLKLSWGSESPGFGHNAGWDSAGLEWTRESASLTSSEGLLMPLVRRDHVHEQARARGRQHGPRFRLTGCFPTSWILCRLWAAQQCSHTPSTGPQEGPT